MREALVADGWAVPPTEANFVWLDLGEHTLDFAAACFDEGIAIRPFACDGARVSIGDAEANDAFLAVAHAYPHRTSALKLFTPAPPGRAQRSHHRPKGTSRHPPAPCKQDKSRDAGAASAAVNPRRKSSSSSPPGQQNSSAIRRPMNSVPPRDEDPHAATFGLVQRRELTRRKSGKRETTRATEGEPPVSRSGCRHRSSRESAGEGEDLRTDLHVPAGRSGLGSVPIRVHSSRPGGLK